MKKFLALAIVIASLSSAQVSAGAKVDAITSCIRAWSPWYSAKSLTAKRDYYLAKKDVAEDQTVKDYYQAKADAVKPGCTTGLANSVEKHPFRYGLGAIVLAAASVYVYKNQEAIKNKLACCKTTAKA